MKFGEGETKVNIKTTLKSSVAVAALFAVAAPVANAEIGNGNKNKLTISGQVVSAIWNGDDGTSDETFITGGRITQTRVRWIASGTLNANATAGATIEMNTPMANDPSVVTLRTIGGTAAGDGTAPAVQAAWDIRHHYIWVNHKKFGKLSLGNTSQGSDGSGEQNYGGSAHGGSLMAAANFGSAINFVKTDGATPSTSTLSVGAVFDNYDAGTRTTVLRYDTPKFMGAQIKTAIINGGGWDVGLYYSGKVGGLKFKAGAGYNNTEALSTTQTYIASASISVLHDSGLNAAFNVGKAGFQSGNATGALQATIEDPMSTYWAIGYQAKMFGVGGTNFLIGHANTEDKVTTLAFDNTDAEAWFFEAVQSFDAIGAQVAIQYSNYQLDADNAGTAYTFDDIDIIALQAVFKF